MAHRPRLPFRVATRALTPNQEADVRRQRRRGVPARSLGAQYGVATRTIYRTLRRLDSPQVEVRAGDWVATFALDDDGPVMVRGWRAAR